MRAVVQRVTRAAVTVDAEVVGEISSGVVVLLGVGRADNSESASYLAGKIANLRIFLDNAPDSMSRDARGASSSSESQLASKIAANDVPSIAAKMNRSLLDIGGSALVISQFTLYGDTRGGRRPSYVQAAPPSVARQLYEEFVLALRALDVRVETGVFQAHMNVELVNDGPVTILLDSEKAI